MHAHWHTCNWMRKNGLKICKSCQMIHEQVIVGRLVDHFVSSAVITCTCLLHARGQYTSGHENCACPVLRVKHLETALVSAGLCPGRRQRCGQDPSSVSWLRHSWSQSATSQHPKSRYITGSLPEQAVATRGAHWDSRNSLKSGQHCQDWSTICWANRSCGSMAPSWVALSLRSLTRRNLSQGCWYNASGEGAAVGHCRRKEAGRFRYKVWQIGTQPRKMGRYRPIASAHYGRSVLPALFVMFFPHNFVWGFCSRERLSAGFFQ